MSFLLNIQQRLLDDLSKAKAIIYGAVTILSVLANIIYFSYHAFGMSGIISLIIIIACIVAVIFTIDAFIGVGKKLSDISDHLSGLLVISIALAAISTLSAKLLGAELEGIIPFNSLVIFSIAITVEFTIYGIAHFCFFVDRKWQDE